MNKNESELMMKIIEKINLMKKYVVNNIDNSYEKYFIKNRKSRVDISVDEVENWKSNILNNIINPQIDNLIKDIMTQNGEKINKNEINISQKEYKIESKSVLNVFSSKDIQDENAELTRNFENEAFNHINENEKRENENVAKFLYFAAHYSRYAFYEGKKLYVLKKQEFINKKGNTISFENENNKREFSCWIKNKEKQEGKKFYEDIFNKIEASIDSNGSNKSQQFLLKLFYDLILLYFHCNLAFPSVVVEFKKEDNFNSDKMIDIINIGRNRKVNFVILPALISNGNYLQNGKSWVFTFLKDTFSFDDSINEELNKPIKQMDEHVKILKNSLKISSISQTQFSNKIKVIINTNMNIPDHIDIEFIFDVKSSKKNNNSKYSETSKYITLNKSFEIDCSKGSKSLIKCDGFRLNEKYNLI